MSHPSEMLATVMIQTENGPVTINESDFDAETMTLADAPGGEPAATAAGDTETAVAASDVVQPGIMKRGRKYVVVNVQTREALVMDGIDAEGYATEAEAGAAAQAAFNA